MTTQRIAIIGAIASILGLVVAIAGLFTQYPFVILGSLIALETAAILIWIYFSNQFHKHKLKLEEQKVNREFPYARENICVVQRYIFETKTTMTFETVLAIRVTDPSLTSLTIPFMWTGRGDINIESVFHNGPLEFEPDAKTGEIRVKYPLPHTYRFGDVLVVQLQMALDDKSSENFPELDYTTRFPTQMCILEVALKYKTTNGPAVLGQRRNNIAHPVSFQALNEIEFDKKTRSYRVHIPNPIIDHTYQLKWDA